MLHSYQLKTILMHNWQWVKMEKTRKMAHQMLPRPFVNAIGVWFRLGMKHVRTGLFRHSKVVKITCRLESFVLTPFKVTERQNTCWSIQRIQYRKLCESYQSLQFRMLLSQWYLWCLQCWRRMLQWKWSSAQGQLWNTRFSWSMTLWIIG